MSKILIVILCCVPLVAQEIVVYRLRSYEIELKQLQKTGNKDVALAEAHFKVAYCLLYRRYERKALPHYKQALALYIANNDKGRIADCHYGLGRCTGYRNSFSIYQHKRALKHYQKALQLYKKSQQNKKIADCLYYYARSLYRAYKRKEAVRRYQEAALAYEKFDKPPLEMITECFFRIGQSFFTEGRDIVFHNIASDKEKAEVTLPIFDKSLNALAKTVEKCQDLPQKSRRFLAESHWLIGLNLCLIGEIKKEQKLHYTKALEHFNIVIELHKERGRFRVDSILCFNKMGKLFYYFSNYKESLAAYQNALKISNKIYTSPNLHVANALAGASTNLIHFGKYQQAWEKMEKAFAIYQKFYHLGWNSPNTYKKMETAKLYFARPLSVFLTLCTVAPKKSWIEKSLEMSLYHKDIVNRVLAQERDIFHTTKSPKLKLLYEKYESLSKQIINLQWQDNLVKREKQKLYALISEKSYLEESISKETHKHFYKLNKIPKLPLSKVQEKLSEQAALVEYVTFTHKQKRQNWLGVFILTNKSVQWISLGKYENIAKLIKQANNQIIDDGNNFNITTTSKQMLTREKQLATLTFKLYQTLWQPLEKHIAERKLLWVAPDAILNTIPFGIFALEKEGKIKYLVEKYNIVYLMNGSTLVKEHKRAGKGFYGIVAAKYNFSNNPGIKTQNGDFVREILKKRWAHLTACGFLKETEKQLVPLLRAGTILKDIAEQAYLTAADISILDLRMIECMVLSRYKTNANKAIEGIAEFKWAFARAGVPNLIVSLWEMSEQNTMLFMTSLQRQIHAKQSLEIWYSLLEVQRKFIKNKEKSHPYFWGNFICQKNYQTLQKRK